MYLEGKGVQQDETKSQKLYTAALAGFLKLEQETPASHVEYKIAGMYDRGNGTEPDAAQAYSWYVKAAEGGHPHAAYRVARACYDGTGTEQDYKAAEQWFIQAANGGDPYAMYSLGKMYCDGTGVEISVQTSYSYFLAAAKLEHEFAQFAVAKALLYGIGTKQNSSEALRWFSKSAEKGNHYAEYQAAELLSVGEERKDIPNNGIQAQFFYNLALNGFIKSDRKNPNDSQEFRIGQMFYRGKGTVLDFTSAAHWFSLSAEKGNVQAQFQLARMFQIGEGVSIDEQRAQELYSAAFQGFMKSLKEEPDSGLQLKIRTMYQFGLGVEKNMTTAKQWFTASADAGNEYATERLNQIGAFEMQASVGSVLGLFRALARNMGNSINDSTTHKYRQDRKLLNKQHQMKAAHGHKHELKEIM
jgi:uncharacterized protein